MATPLLSPALISALSQPGALRNLVSYSEDISQWETLGATVTGPLGLNALGQFSGYAIASNGATWHCCILDSLLAEENAVFSIRLLYRAGTSDSIRFTARYSDTSTTSHNLYGAMGSLPISSGSIALVSETLREDGLTFETILRVSAPRATTFAFRVGPNSDIVGYDITMLAAQIELGGNATAGNPP